MKKQIGAATVFALISFVWILGCFPAYNDIPKNHPLYKIYQERMHLRQEIKS